MKMRIDVQPGLTHVGHHLPDVGHRANGVRGSVDNDDFTLVAQLLHNPKVPRTADETDGLGVGRQVVRFVRVLAVARIRSRSARQVVSDIVTQSNPARHVDDTRERSRRQLVAHQGDISAAGTAGRENTTRREWGFPPRQAILNKPQRSQRIQRLHVSAIVRQNVVGIGRPTLKIVDADRHDVVPIHQFHGIGRAQKLCSTPVVQTQHQARLRSDVGQLAARVANEDLDRSRPRIERPRLGRNGDLAVPIGQGRPARLAAVNEASKGQQQNNRAYWRKAHVTWHSLAMPVADGFSCHP